MQSEHNIVKDKPETVKPQHKNHNHEAKTKLYFTLTKHITRLKTKMIEKYTSKMVTILQLNSILSIKIKTYASH